MSSEVETSLAGECRNPNDQCRNNDERRDKEQLNATLELRASFVIRHSCFVIFTLPSAVRYLVKARVKLGKDRALVQAIDERVLGRDSIAGDEYLHNMEQARVTENGVAQWVETCFCDPPLAEERPHWEDYFKLLSVKDARLRRNCRHENGTEPWACCNCDCTQKLEKKCERKACHFSTHCGQRKATSRPPLQLRPPSRCWAQFVILASSLVGSYSLRASESRKTSKKSKPTHLRIMMRQFVS